MRSYWEKRYMDARLGGRISASWYDEKKEEQEKIFKDFLGECIGLSVLDFGCGTGKLCDIFENYTGADIIPEMIDDDKKEH
jgi:SAM-dependent methyltransferase